MINPDSVQLDTTGWKLVESSSEYIIWRNEIPDQLSLNFFPLRPDITANLSDTQAIENIYRQRVQRQVVSWWKLRLLR